MKRYVASLLTVFCMILGPSAFAVATTAADSENASLRSFSNSEDTFLLHESLAVTQDDLNSNFLEYAETSATVSMPTTLQNNSSASSQTANVVVSCLIMIPNCLSVKPLFLLMAFLW